MVTLEQVKLLESKVGKALSYIETLSSENATLREKLDGYRRRIDELESVVLAFKEDQGRIEAGIVSALERLNQFEDAVERGISDARSTATQSAIEQEPSVAPEEGETVETAAEPEEEPTANDDSEEVEAEDKNGELDIF